MGNALVFDGFSESPSLGVQEPGAGLSIWQRPIGSMAIGAILAWG